MRLSVFFAFIFLSALSNAQTISNDVLTNWKNPSNSSKQRFESFEAHYLHYIGAEPKRVVSASKVHYQLAKKMHTKSEMAKAADNLASAYCQIGEYDSAFIQFDITLNLAKELKDTLSIAAKLGNIGTIHYYIGHYKEAVEFYTQSLSIYREKGVQIQQGYILNNLGLIFSEIKDYDLALKYFQSALAIYTKLEIDEQEGNLWLNMASVYLEKGNVQKALAYIQKAQPILEKSNNQVGLADGHYLSSQIYQQLGKTHMAIVNARKSIDYFQKIENPEKIASSKILLANLLLSTNPQEATKMGEEILPAVLIDGDFTLKMNVYQLLFKCYKAQNQEAKALNMLEKYNSYRDSLSTENEHLTVIREAIQGEYTYKLNQNRARHERIQHGLKTGQKKQLYMVLIAALVVVIGLFIYFRSKISKDRTAKESLLRELERLKKDPQNRIQQEATSTIGGFHLNREKIERSIDRELNETDWNILNLLLEDPVISNKDLAEKIYLSVDGTGSALRRMYEHFEIKESKYKKISLLLEAVKLSN